MCGNPREITILELASLVISLAQSDSEITLVTPQDARTKDDPQTRQPDIAKARALLDWEPQVSLEEGLLQTIAYFKPRVRGEA